jgi:hypothetical protein
MQSSLTTWLFRELPDLSDSTWTVPLGLHAVFPLELLFRVVFAYIILYIYCTYIVCILHHILFFDDSFCICSDILVLLFQQRIIANYHHYCSLV